VARQVGAIAVAALALVLAVAPSLPASADPVVDGLARVRDDGALVLDGSVVRLSGIDIPFLERVCEERIRPVRCAPRAVLALERRVRGFVRCRLTGRRADGVLEGVCTQEGARLLDPPEDLAAWLLLEGLAFARPDAPAGYLQLERLAQARGNGFWSRGLTLR
jgi:endonuclease YncB( thermonuclease family)